MSDYIFGKFTGTAFELNWDFKLSNHKVNLYAIWDTGCTCTMLSYNLIIKRESLSNDERIRYKREALMSHGVTIGVGYGVESQSKEDKKRGEKISNIAKKYNQNPNLITKDEFKALIEYKGLKFVYPISNVRIAGYKYKDCSVQISYDYDNVALIGMEIIKDFYSIIGTKGNSTFLFAKYKYIDGLQKVFEEANIILGNIPDDNEIIDFVNIQDNSIHKLTKEDIHANYINSLIVKTNNKRE